MVHREYSTDSYKFLKISNGATINPEMLKFAKTKKMCKKMLKSSLL